MSAAARLIAGALVVLACSDITATDEGVGSVVVIRPQPAVVEVGRTVQLVAVALGPDGDTVDVPVYWRALDTTVAVDSVTGILTGLFEVDSAGLVARAGGLYSRVIGYRVLAPADTLALTTDSLQTVDPTEAASAPLTTLVQGGDPLAPRKGWRVVYEIVEPVFPDPEDRTVELSGGQLVVAGTTNDQGIPPGVQVLRIQGVAAPPQAVVRVNVWRPSGELVPGSGQRFIVAFPTS